VMRKGYSLTCPHCGEGISSSDLDPDRKCPACGQAIGLPQHASYRPAMNSPIAKAVAVVILIAIVLLLVVGVLVLIFC